MSDRVDRLLQKAENAADIDEFDRSDQYLEVARMSLFVREREVKMLERALVAEEYR